MTSQGMVALVTFSKPYVDDQATKHVLGRTDVTLTSVSENSHQHTTWTKPSERASSRNNMKCRNLVETCGHVHSYPRVQEWEVFLLHRKARTRKLHNLRNRNTTFTSARGKGPRPVRSKYTTSPTRSCTTALKQFLFPDTMQLLILTLTKLSWRPLASLCDARV